MAVDTQKLRERWSALRSSSMLFRSTCDDVEKYVMPRVGSSRVQYQSGSEGTVTWRDPDVWDATALVALTKLAAHVQSAVIPHGLMWASFEFLDATLRDDKAANEWLQKNTELLFHALEESDFYAEMSTAFPEYVGLGNMVIVQEVVEKGGKFESFDYTAIPIGEIEFEEDSKGQIKTLYRCLRWTASQIVDKFGEKTPQHIREKAASPAGTSDREDVIFCIFEREDVTARPIPDLVAAPDQRPYGSVYFLAASGEQLGEEGGYYDCPMHLGRFERTPSSRWGHGLGHQALPTVKGLNAYLELFLTRAALEVDPPMKTTLRGLVSNIDRRPGGVTVSEDIDDVAPLDGGKPGRMDAGKIAVEDQRAEVRRLFREDQLELRDSPQMTATEAQIRYDIMLKLMGPTMARLLSEVVSRMLLSAYRALYRAGRFPAAPPSVKQAGGEIRIQYQSPMARSRRTDEVASLERLASFASGLLKMGFTEAGMVFDAEAALREVSKLLDVSVSVLRSKTEVKQMMQQRAQAEQRAAAASAAKDEGAAMAAAASANGGQLPGAATGAFPTAPMPALTPGGQVA